MKAHRPARIAEVIREVASETILFELQDPRIRGVTVTRAEVSGDLQHAKVFVSIMGSDKDQAICLHALKRCAGLIQSKLGSRLKTRFTPHVSIVVDEGIKNSIHISKLIQEALADLPTKAPDPALGDPEKVEVPTEAEEEGSAD